MSVKTKIVVLHRKMLYIAAAVLVCVLIAIVLIGSALGNKDATMQKVEPDKIEARYKPGVYYKVVALGEQTMEIRLVLDENHINGVGFSQIDEVTQTMFPLAEPTMKELSAQIVEKQSVDAVEMADNNQYTSAVLLEAIHSLIKKGSAT